MIELEDITLKEYFELEEKENYDFAIKYSKSVFNKPLDIFKIGDMTELSFGLIKDLQYDIEQGLSWMKFLDYLEEITGIDVKKIVNYKLTAICRVRSYILKEIERINEIENELLAYYPDSDEKNAGIDEFNKFGNYGQLRKLANEDVTKLDEVKKIKYSIGLMELYYQRVESDYQLRLMKIKSKKH
jgi:hypothetical protein